MRKRFAAGDTYESSDYRSVVQLVESAKRVPAVQPRSFVLVSSLGARPGAGYLGWTHKAEQVVRERRLPFAVLRPSVLDSTHAGSQPSDGVQRKPPPLLGAMVRLIGALPGLRDVSLDWRPMPVEVLCSAIARILEGTAPNAVLVGRDLWRLAQVGG